MRGSLHSGIFISFLGYNNPIALITVASTFSSLGELYLLNIYNFWLQIGRRRRPTCINSSMVHRVKKVGFRKRSFGPPFPMERQSLL